MRVSVFSTHDYTSEYQLLTPTEENHRRRDFELRYCTLKRKSNTER
jgi:hypothetical protein